MNWKVVTMCLLLSVLDLGGAVLAKEAIHAKSAGLLFAGTIVFLGLFAAYVLSLMVGSLTVVTIGWIAMSAIGAMVLDRLKYHTHISPMQYIGAVLVIVGGCLLGV